MTDEDDTTYVTYGFWEDSFKADRRMRCQNCPDPIEVGDWIVEARDTQKLQGPRGFVHDECVGFDNNDEKW